MTNKRVVGVFLVFGFCLTALLLARTSPGPDASVWQRWRTRFVADGLGG